MLLNSDLMSQRQPTVTLKINRITVPEAERVVYFRNHLCTLNHFLCIPQLNQNMKLTRTLFSKKILLTKNLMCAWKALNLYTYEISNYVYRCPDYLPS